MAAVLAGTVFMQTNQNRKEDPMQSIDPAVDPAIEHNVRAFLKGLNSGGGPHLESMSPLDARQVLVNAQASVQVGLSGIEV
jgi:acetyl esterase